MAPVPGRVEQVDVAEVDRWCRTHLGAGVAEELFRAGHLSEVVGVRLTSQMPIVVKIRRPAGRLEACSSIHRAVFDRGYPCPQPLVGLQAFGEWVASAEALVAGGELFPDSGRSPAPFAEALANLVALTPSLHNVGSLEPPLPWTPGKHRGSGLWPWPDDRDVDLNLVGGPAWIDQAGWAAQRRLAGSRQPAVIGHGDWHSANLRWVGHHLRVAFDWDSTIAAPEPVIAGLAAAVYPVTREGTEATIEETQAFLEAYGVARGRPFNADETEEAWAAGLWNRSFDAKKQLATDGHARSLSEKEARERCRLAGIT
jgi:hypothetical protein